MNNREGWRGSKSNASIMQYIINRWLDNKNIQTASLNTFRTRYICVATSNLSERIRDLILIRLEKNVDSKHTKPINLKLSFIISVLEVKCIVATHFEKSKYLDYLGVKILVNQWGWYIIPKISLMELHELLKFKILFANLCI